MVGGQPPHDDVIDHRSVGVVEQVGVLGASGSDPFQVIAEGGLDCVPCVRPPEIEAAEMTHVEQGCARTACCMLGQRAHRIADRHLPSTEGDHPGAEATVDGIQR